MRHYLVVAHKTLDSPDLLEVLRDRASRGPATFHLLVPDDHQGGFFWDEGSVRLQANQALEAARIVTEAGSAVQRIVAVIDRLEGARQNVEQAGFRFESLFTVRDLGIGA